MPASQAPFDPRAFLRIATELSQRPDDEAALRSAISRAYYAAFWVARQFVMHRSGVRLASHSAVWEKIRRSGDLYRPIGENGSRLQRKRNEADYEEIVPDLSWRAAQALGIADRIIKELAPTP